MALLIKRSCSDLHATRLGIPASGSRFADLCLPVQDQIALPYPVGLNEK